MKKLKSFKKMSAKATAALLCLATSATCMTLAVPYMSTSPRAEEIDGSQVTITDGVNLADSCDYGKTFKVPANAKVTAPDGSDATPAEGSELVAANQIGNYKVTFEDSGLSYDFYVRVRLDEEYFLKVDYNGADIPSYVQTGKTFTLPEAHVYYYDDNNILQEYPEQDYTVTARDSLGNAYSFAEGGNKTFTASATTGKVFITYDAVVGKNGGTKHFSQTYTVNVQAKVQTGTSNPTLSVSGVQRDVSVNRAVTLPKATATDSYDENVKVEITVTDPHGDPVKNVGIDENGYAYALENAKPVAFDNDQAMTFYPTETGSYKVTYTAYSDAYDGGNVGKSSTREYYMTVSDLVAPVFKNVEEWRIPETWGLNVEAAEGTTNVPEGGKITFTVPDVVDNKDHMPKDADDKDNVISMYFRITDSDNSKTIVEFSNILAVGDSEDSKFKYNSTYEKKDDSADSVTFNKSTPFTFDFNKYAKKNSKDETQALPGTYTVLYRARDKANNTSSRTFTVTLQDTYTDTSAPTTAEVTVPDYISAADTTFTVPQASVADASDTRLKKVYRIYNNEGASYDVEGGEVADIENGNLVFNKGKENEHTLKLTDKLYFFVSATDKVGNFTSNAKNEKGESIDINADTTDYEKCEAVVEIISSTEASNIEYADNMTVTGTLETGKTVSYAGFTIKTSEKMRNYTGFEVAARDPKGNPLNVTLETMSTIVGNNAKIYVQNISFNLSVATEENEYYTVTVRVFDVNGNNKVYGYKLGNVAKSENGNIDTQAISTIGTSGDVETTYKLHNEVIKGISGNEGDVYRVVRKISGGVFALMGSEFTAKTQGSYTVSDGYILEATKTGATGNVKENRFEYGAAKPAGGNNGVYNFNVNDTAAPVIEIQGVMPTYKDFADKNDKNEKIDLPTIVAYTENGEAEVKIEVKGPKNGNKIDLEEYKDGDNKGKKYFTATADGAYTVTVTATYANATPATATYTINVGDVQGPEFSLKGEGTPTTVTYTVGQSFKFYEMLLDDESENGVEITKTLTDPSKETVSDATISGSYTNNKDRTDNGTEIKFNMAGTYKVTYTAKDTYGNETKQEYEITVVSSGSSTPTTWTTLSTVLIIVAVVLLAGVIVYVVRFRKVKK